jgi:hypothetical protein
MEQAENHPVGKPDSDNARVNDEMRRPIKRNERKRERREEHHHCLSSSGDGVSRALKEA